jgi:type I restriction enzyme R subunit
MPKDNTPPQVRMDERNHVEEPFLHQLETMPGLHWQVLRLDNYQTPAETQRTEFTQVMMKDDLATSLKKINPWLEDDQVQEVIERINRFEGDNLLQNNELALQLLLKGTAVAENRKTGEKSPNVVIVDLSVRKTILM